MSSLTLTQLPLRRSAYALLAIALAGTAAVLAADGAWPALAAGMVGPDLALLAGGGRGLAKGQLHPRAVPAYNAVHRLWGPVVVLAAAGAGVLGAFWLVLGVAWAAHVAMDRAAGYGLRDAAGFQRAR
jgi:hypothetical protein